jgi:WD40 repeat protein|tara:strand:+ start:316 stop:558 length:243 start_codon:yes stop_codon:yes gene_type:complete
VEDIGQILLEPKLAGLKRAGTPTKKRNAHRTFKDDKNMDEDGAKKVGSKAGATEAHNESGFKEQGAYKKVEPIVKESSIQ